MKLRRPSRPARWSVPFFVVADLLTVGLAAGATLLWVFVFSDSAIAVAGVIVFPAVIYVMLRFVVRPLGDRLLTPPTPPPPRPPPTVPAQRSVATPRARCLEPVEIAAKAWELEICCKEIAHAEHQLSVADEVATEQAVEAARLDYVRTSVEMSRRIREIGELLHTEFSDDDMRRVLDRVDREHRATVSAEWSSISRSG